MLQLAPVLVCLSLGSAPPVQEKISYGYLWQPAYALDAVRRGPAIPYEPQPGDMLIMNTWDRAWKASYRLALSGPPTHSAMVFRMPDGRMGMEEAGIGMTLSVEINPLTERMPQYPGEVYVRRRKVPLTEDQSARLTDFALAVHKKRVPPYRFMAQISPFRTRGPIRTEFIGQPHGVRNGYFCSELVVETCVAAGLLDAKTARPSATYPRDLFYDHSANPYLNRHLNLSSCWHVPALWTAEK